LKVWPSGAIDSVNAYLKANGKFSCQGTTGRIQKARREDTIHGQDSASARKYYLGDEVYPISEGGVVNAVEPDLSGVVTYDVGDDEGF